MTWSVADYNANPALNPSINTIDIAEGSAAAGYNNALRQIMADIAAWTATNGVTYPISIVHGGHGQTTAPLGLAALGGLADSFRDLNPITKTGAFAFADVERGRGIFYSGATAAATIDIESGTPITYGAVYPIYNGGSGILTVTRTTIVTLRVNGGTSNANAAIAVGGQASVIKWGTDYWTVSGTGVSAV